MVSGSSRHSGRGCWNTLYRVLRVVRAGQSQFHSNKVLGRAGGLTLTHRSTHPSLPSALCRTSCDCPPSCLTAALPNSPVRPNTLLTYISNTSRLDTAAPIATHCPASSRIAPSSAVSRIAANTVIVRYRKQLDQLLDHSVCVQCAIPRDRQPSRRCPIHPPTSPSTAACSANHAACPPPRTHARSQPAACPAFSPEATTLHRIHAPAGSDVHCSTSLDSAAQALHALHACCCHCRYTGCLVVVEPQHPAPSPQPAVALARSH